MLRHGQINLGLEENNTPAAECWECDSFYQKWEKASCGDGLGGHSWDVVTYRCVGFGECPENIKDCPQKKEGLI